MNTMQRLFTFVVHEREQNSATGVCTVVVHFCQGLNNNRTIGRKAIHGSLSLAVMLLG